MRHFFRYLIAFMMLCPLMVVAQEAANVPDGEEDYSLSLVAPTYDSIFKMVKDASGQYYYPKLTERFLKGDTTLDMQDLRCLYYGYPVQGNFNPYWRSETLKELEEMMHGDSLSQSDFRRAYKLACDGLKQKPSDLTMAFWKYIAASNGFAEESEEMQVSELQFVQLQLAIISSGNGTAEKPYFVTTMQHSYTIMNIMDVRPRGQMLKFLNGFTCDVFPVVNDDGEEDTLYFEVSQCLKYLNNVFGQRETKKRTNVKDVKIGLGTHFVLKPNKIKRKNSKFDIVVLEGYSRPLDMFSNSDSLFTNQQPGTIEGYFGYDSDSSHVLLVTKSSGVNAVDFDTEIRISGTGSWEATSNYGCFPNAVGTEIWPANVVSINISNLRKKK